MCNNYVVKMHENQFEICARETLNLMCRSIFWRNFVSWLHCFLFRLQIATINSLPVNEVFILVQSNDAGMF